MNYTIATLTEYMGDCGNLILNIDKDGSWYLVGLYNDKTNEYTHRTFRNKRDALKVFNQLAEWMVDCFYKEHEKREYLLKVKV